MEQQLGKGTRIRGDQRSKLAGDYAKRYDAGESIRSIAGDSGRSFGFVHGVLKEAGVALRGRGGATRGGGQQKPGTTKTAAAKKTAPKKASTASAPKATRKGTTKTAR